MISFGMISLYVYSGSNTQMFKQFKDMVIHKQYGHFQLHAKGFDEFGRKDPYDYLINNYTDLAIELMENDNANLAMATALSSPMDNPEDGASDKIIEYSKKFEKKEKDNPIAMTYYGLGCSLVSRDSKNPFVKMMNVKKAISIFDKAASLLENQPREWFVRYMRANFYINLPETFKKRDAAEEDFAFVHAYYTGQNEMEGYMCNGYYNLGEIEKSRGNIDLAVQYWKESVVINQKLNLNSKEGEKAAKRLELFKD